MFYCRLLQKLSVSKRLFGAFRLIIAVSLKDYGFLFLYDSFGIAAFERVTMFYRYHDLLGVLSKRVPKRLLP